MAILVGEPLPILRDAVAAKAKFAVVFAAGFAEVGSEGGATPGRDGADHRQRRPPRARPQHQPQCLRGLPRRPARQGHRPHHPERPPGPPDLPGPGDRHQALALGAGRQRGRHGVGRLHQLLLEPRVDRRGRLLHRGLQERADPAAGRRRGRPAQGPDRRRQGRPHRRGQVHGQGPHGPPDRVRRRRLRRVPPVRRAARRRARPAARGLGRAGPHQGARARRHQAPDPRRRRARLRLFDLGRHRGPHGRHGRGGRPRAALAHQGLADRSCTSGSRPTSACRTRWTTAAPRCATGAAPRSSRRCWPTPTWTSCCARSPARCPPWATSSARTSWRRPPRRTSPSSWSGAPPSAPRRPTRRRCSRARCRPSARSPTRSWRPRPTSTITASSPPTSRPSPTPSCAPTPARRRRSRCIAPGGTAAAARASRSRTPRPCSRPTALRCPRSASPRRPAEAAKAAKKIGYPVVMKIVSADILHKSDLGLVAVGVRDEDDARRTYKRLVADRQEGGAQGHGRRGAGGPDGPGRRDRRRHRPGRPLRAGRDVRPRRGLRGGAARRDVPRPALHDTRRHGHAGRAPRGRAPARCARTAGRRPRRPGRRAR